MRTPAPSKVTLPDGRTLAYDDVGDPRGDVVVYLHGAPDCRLARHPDDGTAAARGIRLLAVDRAGYGRSSPPPDATFAAVAGDVAALLDALDLPSCRLLAWSAGGPRALAAATHLGDRCTAITAYAAMPPVEAALDPAARAGMPRREVILTAVLEEGVAPAEVAAEIAGFMLPIVPVPAELSVDIVREALGRRARAEVESVPGLVEILAASMVEATAAHGRAGVEADMVAELTLGQLEHVVGARCPVRLVYGEKDPVAGPPIGAWYAARLADATVEVWPDATHHSLFPRWGDLLA